MSNVCSRSKAQLRRVLIPPPLRFPSAAARIDLCTYPRARAAASRSAHAARRPQPGLRTQPSARDGPLRCRAPCIAERAAITAFEPIKQPRGNGHWEAHSYGATELAGVRHSCVTVDVAAYHDAWVSPRHVRLSQSLCSVLARWVERRSTPSGLCVSPSNLEHGIGAPTTTLIGVCSGSRPLPRNRPRP